MPTEKKQRNTHTKQAVIHVFQSFAAPIALSELHQFIKMSLPKTAFSTVFRIVRQLEVEKKIIHIDWRERGSRYEWAELPHHHHLVCEACQTVTDIDDKALNFNNRKMNQTTGYQINHHSIEMRGLCPSCQKSTEDISLKS